MRHNDLNILIIFFDHVKGVAKLFFLFLLRPSYADVCWKTELREITFHKISYFSNKMRKKIYFAFC